MAKKKLSELEKAECDIHDFADRFDCVMTISNAKGQWLCRCTKKNVQVFVVLGETLYSCMVNTAEKIKTKRGELGV